MVYQYWLNYLKMHDVQSAKKVIKSKFGDVCHSKIFEFKNFILFFENTMCNEIAIYIALNS